MITAFVIESFAILELAYQHVIIPPFFDGLDFTRNVLGISSCELVYTSARPHFV